MRVNTKRAEYLRGVVDRFVRAKKKPIVEVGEVVAWGLARGELEILPEEQAAVIGAMLSDAMRGHTVKDDEGNKVRLRYCVIVKKANGDGKMEQHHLWSHVDEAPDEFLMEAIRQRREQIGADVRSLKTDLDYLNARRQAAGKRPIQLSFDFTDDLDKAATA